MTYYNRLHLKNGFTLAEVLITLVIIGVIAALTVPTLMKNTQKQELVTGLKKANSTLQQALINMARNNDAAVGDYSFLNDVVFIDEFAKVTNVLKKSYNKSGCLSGENYNTMYKWLNGGGEGSLGDNNIGECAVTADGMIYIYSHGKFNSVNHGISAEDAVNSRGWIAVDVNGIKGPNVWGRDLFLFELISNKGIVPGGSASTATCSKNSHGYSCAAKVLRENAINY